jgi:hypothetical protein
MNTAVMSPVQTDNSNTAASGDASLNIITVRIALVTARPIVARRRLGDMTAHVAVSIKAVKSTLSIIVYLHSFRHCEEASPPSLRGGWLFQVGRRSNLSARIKIASLRSQ